MLKFFNISSITKLIIGALTCILFTSNLLSISINKLSFYKAFESNSEAIITLKIKKLETLTPSNIKDAYIGALTMKKSQFQNTPKEKIAVFKSGKFFLENAIKSNPQKVEYRFLRLVIQENTPKILKYKSNIKEDTEIIHASYNTLESTVKRIVIKYAKSSENLNQELLN